jgi:hypothetical protein
LRGVKSDDELGVHIGDLRNERTNEGTQWIGATPSKKLESWRKKVDESVSRSDSWNELEWFGRVVPVLGGTPSWNELGFREGVVVIEKSVRARGDLTRALEVRKSRP